MLARGYTYSVHMVSSRYQARKAVSSSSGRASPSPRHVRGSFTSSRFRHLFHVLTAQVLRRTGPFPRRRKYRDMKGKTLAVKTEAKFKLLSVRETFERLAVPPGADASWEEPKAPSALQVHLCANPLEWWTRCTSHMYAKRLYLGAVHSENVLIDQLTFNCNACHAPVVHATMACAR